VLLLVGIAVDPIEVLAVGVKSPLASGNAIWVENRNNFELVVIKENFGLLIFEVGKLVDQALEHILSWCFSTVDSTGEINHWLILKEGIL